MARFVPIGLFLALVCAVSLAVGQATAKKEVPEGPMVLHSVFFSLKDNSPQAKEAMVNDCRKLLVPNPGVVFYFAGTLAEDAERDVSERDYDVALHIVFTDKAALDAYLLAPKHRQFTDKHKGNWKKFRVFDSYVTGGRPHFPA